MQAFTASSRSSGSFATAIKSACASRISSIDLLRRVPILGASLLGALTLHACVQTSPTRLENPFKPITLGELATNFPQYAHEHVAFSATIERTEETTQGTWIHLRDGEQRLLAYVPISFSGTLRE